MARTHFNGPVASANGFEGAITGNITGNVTGNVTGSVTGDVTGNLTGNVTGNVTGNLTGNVTGDLTGNVTGTSVTATTAKTDYQKFLGVQDVVLFGTGTWTITRLAEANYVARHTAAIDTSILGIDIQEPMRSAASKGFSLASIDVIYSIGTAALTAHSATLDKISFVDTAAATITSVPITGTLTTATAANVKVVNLPVTTPAFNNTADSKYVFELTVNADLTSAYDFYGIVLKFSRNDL